MRDPRQLAQRSTPIRKALHTWRKHGLAISVRRTGFQGSYGNHRLLRQGLRHTQTLKLLSSDDSPSPSDS